MTARNGSGSTVRLSAVIVGAALGLLGLHFALAGERTDFASAGLGLRTDGVFLKHGEETFHCRDASDAGDCLEATVRRSLPRRLLWLGASQLYGINRRQPGDKTAPWHVFDALSSRKVDLLTFSQPNGNLQEHYVLFEHLRQHTDIGGLIVAAVYDDMRETGVRPTIAQAMHSAKTGRALAATDFGAALLAGTQSGRPVLESSAQARASSSEGGDGPTWQNRSESWLTAQLESCCAVETLRGEARGRILLAAVDTRRFLATLRNRYTRDWRAFQVPIPATAYARNRAALAAMLATARRADIPSLLYIAPRPTDFFPYDPDGYAAYKADMERLAKSQGAAFVNLEDTVANEHWGLVDLTFGFPVHDPFHFAAAGHALLGRALLPAIEAHLIAAP